MGKNYKILINPSPPDPERIKANKDFDALMKRVAAEPAPARVRPLRRLYIYAAAAAAALIGIVLAFFVLSSDLSYEEKAEAYFASQPYINPPLQHVKLNPAVAEVDANLGDTLTFKSGSRLIIPTDAFINDQGEAVRGIVDIEFIEMHDFVDFFISGIPMTYDSNQTTYQLESAGMLKIKGTQNGQVVNLAPGKAIDIELISSIRLPRVNASPPKFNIYHLNTQKREWVYSSPDQLRILEELSATTNGPLQKIKAELKISLQQIEQKRDVALLALNRKYPIPETPEKPIRGGSGTTFFLNDFLPGATVSDEAQNKINELSNGANGNILTELAPNSAPFDPGFINIDRAIVSLDEEGYFKLELLKDNDSSIIRLRPVLNGNVYNNAMEKYEAAYQRYEQALDDRKAQIQTGLDSINVAYQREVEATQEAFNDKVAGLVEEGVINPEDKIQYKVLNKFKVNAFGIWNCDRPIKKSAESVKVRLLNQNGKRIVNKTAFLVDQSTNTIYKYLATGKTPIRYNESSKLLLWVVEENNKIAISKLNGQLLNQKNELVLRTSNQSVRDERDVRKLLYF